MKNSIIAAISLFTKLKSRPVSEEELLAGLPFMGRENGQPIKLNEEHLLRLCEKAGFHGLIRPALINEISELALPVILFLQDGTACIFAGLDEKGNCRVFLPESDLTAHNIDMDTLAKKYLGVAMYLGDSPSAEPGRSPSSSKGHWFWRAIKLCLPIYFDVILASFVISVFALVGPLFTMNVYDRVVPNNAVDTLWVLAIGTIVVTVFDAILKFLRTYFTEIAAKKSDLLISARIFEKVMNLRMEEAPRNIGSFASNLREYDSIRNFLTSSVLLIVVDLPFTVILLWVVYYLAGKIVLVPMSMMFLMLLYALIIRGPLYSSIAANYENSSRKNSLVVETLSGLQDIKQLNSSSFFQGKWEQIVASIAGKGIISRMISTSVSTLTGVLIQMNTVLTIIVGVYMIAENEMTMGALIAIMILSSKIIAPVGQLVGLISSWDQTRIAYDSLRNIMGKAEEADSSKPLIRRSNFFGEIEFREVSFSYPGSEVKAINQLSCKIKPGEHVAILGKMGAGKSTIHRLLLDFFRPQEGRVLIDNIDLAELSPIQLRNHIIYVPQDFYLFSGTLRENILMRAPYVDGNTLLAAIQAGGLENFIQSSPRGIDTFIQERGANLSGGQRQGVAIARAFLTDASIVLLDEPANSMDGNTEQQVKEHLRKRIAGKTMIMTTHKHSMLDLVERIMVLDNGRLVFDGNKEAFFKAFSGKGVDQT